MPKGTINEDRTMLSMALLGYESEKQRIEEKIAELRSRLNGSSATPVRKYTKAEVPAEPAESSKKRVLSPAARKRIAAAQKKRWAEHRRQAAATSSEE